MDCAIGQSLILRGTAEKSHPVSPIYALWRLMNQTGYTIRRRHVVDYAAVARAEMRRYCAARPSSPSAVRRPQLFFRNELWIALLGPNLEEGVVGIGATIPAALRAFDAQYLASSRPPNEQISPPRKPPQL